MKIKRKQEVSTQVQYSSLSKGDLFWTNSKDNIMMKTDETDEGDHEGDVYFVRLESGVLDSFDGHVKVTQVFYEMVEL